MAFLTTPKGIGGSFSAMELAGIREEECLLVSHLGGVTGECGPFAVQSIG